tara:strand:- start:685 stop:1764 length:1080 start_codon:yes stop_codon:yes gene_type:complete
MTKEYTALGLMSGTSGDGVDASIIQSDGQNKYKVILDKYFKYDKDTCKNIHELKENINNSKDLKNLSKEITELEKKITLFHTRVVEDFSGSNIDFLGFHGQTIFHNADEKISRQLGDGKLLSQLTKKNVVYNFRENDLRNGGQGAPLTPIFHKLLVNQKKINLPVTILNIGGIANITSIQKENKIFSSDIGPGNCLIDKWIRLNSDKNYDDKGSFAKAGKINQIILDQSLENFCESDINKKKSYDIKDFDLSFVRGLSLKDGAAILTEFTAEILSKKKIDKKVYICGGGRKNLFLLEKIKKKINGEIKLIDDLGINGDFVESQAFAYLAIRSYLKLPISFPETTGVKKPCIGGTIIEAK